MMLTGLPLAIDWLSTTRDAKNEHEVLGLLEWVIGYRKAKCFVEVHQK